MIGDVHRGCAEGEQGEDVGFHGIADHEKIRGRNFSAVQDFGVGRLVFFSDNLDGVEMRGEAGFRELALLVA